jgi:hypothetical protein
MAFSNLNHHFQQLLDNSSLLFKIKQIDYSLSDEICFQNWMQMVHINKQQILSIHLLMSLYFNHLLALPFINSSFERLESLVLLSPEPSTLIFILNELISLPRLFSLTITQLYSLSDLTNIYQIVLALPVLKYYKISASNLLVPISLPISTNQQPSTIEYLIIDHCCTFNELSAIVFYTPRLRHLNFLESYEVPGTYGIPLPSTLTHLTYLRIRVCHLKFDEFEMFIRQIRPKLKVLIFITLSEEIAYLDAHRWEQLIVQDLPQLEKFSLRYYENIDDDEDHEPQINFEGSNPFLSSFWLERQWILDLEIESENIVYSIGPYKYILKNFYKINQFISCRKRWYEQPNVDNSTMEFSKSGRLSLSYIPSSESYELLIMHIKNILNVTQIHHLEISEEKLCFDILMQITNSLPQVTTMKLHSLSLDQARDSETDELIIFPSTESINHITKVYLEKMFAIEEVYSLMKLCRYMSYLKVDSFDNMKVDVFIRNVLKKINHDANPHLRLLCFPAPATDDSMIKTLETMKNDYIIKRVGDHIFLQWK